MVRDQERPTEGKEAENDRVRPDWMEFAGEAVE